MTAERTRAAAPAQPQAASTSSAGVVVLVNMSSIRKAKKKAPFGGTEGGLGVLARNRRSNSRRNPPVPHVAG